VPDYPAAAIEGYVSVYSEEKRISPPIPFCMLESLRLSVPKGGFLKFRLHSFHCWAVPLCCGDESGFEQIKLMISMKTDVSSKRTVSLLIPQVDPRLRIIGRACIHTQQICDCIRLCSGCCLQYTYAALAVDSYQYNAVSDGTQRIYRNSDELKEYGSRGILSPQEVSCYDVFVNGVLQPKTNYTLKKNELVFTTQDIPSASQAVMILFTTWRTANGRIVNATSWQYNAVSDGEKKIYTDGDELKEYGKRGIPSPNEISFFNLYINGVLQPKINYRVKKGILRLTTVDAPVKGALVILEFIVIRDPGGQLFRTETCAYNTYSNGGKIYNNQDELQMYGTDGIPDPGESSFQKLFVNGVIQPHVNYLVRKGSLILQTENSPAVGAPITLQSGSSVPVASCDKIQMSDSARAHWKKEYADNREPCPPGQDPMLRTQDREQNIK
jgi:hypothetical protein